MARKLVLLSSLSVGRCFTLEPEAAASEEGPKADEVRRTQPILQPRHAWKVTGEGEDGLSAENAAGEARTFPLDTKVVEIPRDGFQKLAARAAQA